MCKLIGVGEACAWFGTAAGFLIWKRSDITDFQEVVRLDTKYINEWSIGLDVKILFKTVLTVLHKDGAV